MPGARSGVTLRAGAEAIHQAAADCETSRLPPNPTLAINGTIQLPRYTTTMVSNIQ